MRPLLVLSTLTVLAASACASAGPAAAVPPVTPTNTTATNTTASNTTTTTQRDASAANDFNVSMYGALRREQGNLFFSAPSMRQALGVAYLGARGDTAKEMSSAIHLDPDLQKSAAFARGENADFQSAKGEATLDVANRLWVQKGLELHKTFLRLGNEAYGAPVDQVDFLRQPGDARKTINTWVEKQTHDKIKDLLPEPAITPDTRLVITNAVFFKGSWAQQFDKGATRDEAFLVDGNKSTDVPMMHHQGSYGYAEGDGAQVLEMKYEKSDLAMDVILPTSAAGLRDVEDKVLAGKMGTWTSALSNRTVNVTFPKLTVKWGRSVKEELKALGMKQAFESDADFTGIAPARTAGGNLSVSDVIHKAFIAIDEEGTEAAAATAVIVGREATVSVPVVTKFKAAHPFLFVIRDTKHDRVLFMGRVTNPKG